MLMLVRADASVQAGTGHVMRCMALAQAYMASGGQCAFVSASLTPGLISRLSDEAFTRFELASEPGSLQDAEEFAAIANRMNASWTVVDGYQFAEPYLQAIKAFRLRLIAIDDSARAGRGGADIVVNPNLYASPSLSGLDDSSTILLLGTRYALLRREFWEAPETRPHPHLARNLLVTLGGSDPGNVSATVLRCINMVATAGGEVVVVSGGGNPHFESLLEQARTCSWRTNVLRDVRDMTSLMRWADLAIAASGTTAWELAAMGVPTLLVPIADNQEPVARSLHERNAAINLGPAAELDCELVARTIDELIKSRVRRSELASNARQIVDGRGAHRVVEQMRKREIDALVEAISLRKVDPGDSRLLWEWANEPAVRGVSFSSDPISWEEHERWMAQKVMDPTCRMYIGLNDECEAIGQVRFQIDDKSAKISVSLDARFRGKGYGVLLIRTAIREFFLTTEVGAIEAFVKPSNDSSLRVFQKVGFTAVGEQSVHGQAAVHFLLEKSDLS